VYLYCVPGGRFCQAESGLATVSKTKGLEKRHGAKRESLRQFWQLSSARAAPFTLSRRMWAGTGSSWKRNPPSFRCWNQQSRCAMNVRAIVSVPHILRACSNLGLGFRV